MMEKTDIVQTSELVKSEKVKIEKPERILILISLIAAILVDRLIFNADLDMPVNLFFFAAIFELCFMILVYIFNWKRIYKKPLIWLASGFTAVLCVWNFLFDYRSYYGILTFAVIPAALMMTIQFSTNRYNLKQVKEIVMSWFAGWLIQPFSALPRFISVMSDTIFPKSNPVFKKIIAALAITIPLSSLLMVLLSGADKVFGHYVNEILGNFNLANFILHLILITIALVLFYSFLWNSRYAEAKKTAETERKEFSFDAVISYITLGTVLVLYILFCAIQFTYLFARMGLPAGISYSEYAREGFAQIVAIAAINLIIFGTVLKYSRKSKGITIMLYVLLAVTVIMLMSGFARLNLYIETFGMTFLRLISAWFIIYLAVVLIFCALRLLKDKIPLVGVCAFVLLGWYIVLGYINPDAFILKYNLSASSDPIIWTEANSDYIINELSDNAILILAENNPNIEVCQEIFAKRYASTITKYNAASIKLKNLLKY